MLESVPTILDVSKVQGPIIMPAIIRPTLAIRLDQTIKKRLIILSFPLCLQLSLPPLTCVALLEVAVRAPSAASLPLAGDFSTPRS